MGTHTHTRQGGVGDMSPHKGSRRPLRRLGAGTTRIAAATSKPTSSRWAVGMGWAGLGPCQWDIPAGTAGDGDSQQNPFLLGLLVRPAEEGEPALRRAQAAGVHTDHRKWDLGHCVPSGSHQPRRVACKGGGVMGDRVLFVSQQLRMFDMNGDGKLGLSEMSR